MSACKVSGVDDGAPNATLCAPHDAEFRASGEFRRFNDTSLGFDAGMAALVDFIARARAERLNGRTP